MTTDDEPSDIPEEKSKSQRKREHQDLQAMAVRLLELSPANYAKVNLPPDVQDPVDLGRTLTKGARKRQIKFIAAKLQGEVAENVRESLAIIEYLEELHPDPPMIGRTPLERAQTRRIERLCELGVLGRQTGAVG